MSDRTISNASLIDISLEVSISLIVEISKYYLILATGNSPAILMSSATSSSLSPALSYSDSRTHGQLQIESLQHSNVGYGF